MTTLLSASLAVLLPVLGGVLLLALLAATALLVLLALLALDVLLERHGVDRRAGVRRAWNRLRRPEPVRGHPAESGGGGTREPRAADRDAHEGGAPRIPFSARRPARPARAPEPVPAPETARSAAPAPDRRPEVGGDGITVTEGAWDHRDAVAPTAIPAAESPAPVADAVTEVLAVERPATPRGRVTRTPRVSPARTPPPAAEPVSASEPPADRDSAIDRLFAPLLDSDKTEPLPTPRATRPARKPRDQA